MNHMSVMGRCPETFGRVVFFVGFMKGMMRSKFAWSYIVVVFYFLVDYISLNDNAVFFFFFNIYTFDLIHTTYAWHQT